MFRVAASTVARRAAVTRGGTARCAAVSPAECFFHSSSQREDEASSTPAAKKADAPASSGWWDNAYAVPLGIAFAVPAINYEWYLVNEETQLAACFIAFTAIMYKQFGGVIKEALEADGKRNLAEHNAAEDAIINMLKDKIKDVKLQENIVQDALDVKAIKIQTYEKLNKIGEVKPLYDFKQQVERLLHLMEQEEANMLDKGKHDLMAEATAFVTAEFIQSKALKKTSLDLAVLQLKGASTGGKDPVKETYMKFFADKKAASAKVDEKKEILQAREAIVTKLNSACQNEGYFFEFGRDMKPKLVAKPAAKH